MQTPAIGPTHLELVFLLPVAIHSFHQIGHLAFGPTGLLQRLEVQVPRLPSTDSLLTVLLIERLLSTLAVW